MRGLFLWTKSKSSRERSEHIAVQPLSTSTQAALAALHCQCASLCALWAYGLKSVFEENTKSEEKQRHINIKYLSY